MRKEGIFFDLTEEYAVPPEPEKNESFSLKLRTAADADLCVECVLRDEVPVRMSRIFSDTEFSVYEVTLTAKPPSVCFCFRISDAEETVYYNHLGVSHEHCREYDFVIYPGFSVPEWAKGKIIYQIFPDRFCKSRENCQNERNYTYEGAAAKSVPWGKLPESFDVVNFQGGDLAGIRSKLDELQALGVTILYLNPIFVSPSNHRYDIADYKHIDPCLGTEEEFAELVSELHRRGMRILLDGVFNHCSDRHPWLKEHPEYFCRGEDDRYELWWNNRTLIKLNYEGSRALCDEIFEIAQYWMRSPYNIDGWRLDVAADIGHSGEFNHAFWREFRKKVKSVNPESFLLAEHYGNPQEWLRGNEWDSIMNYDGFMDPVSLFFTGMEKHSDSFSEAARGDGAAFAFAMRSYKARMSMPSYLSAMNALDNHDHSRFLTRTNGFCGRLAVSGSSKADENTDTAVLRQAVAFQMTWQGCPTVYYGDEAGLTGFTDPDSRRAYPWGKEDRYLLEYYQILGKIRNSSPALQKGSLHWLTAQHGFIAYARTLGNEKYIIVIHTDCCEKEIELSVWPAGIRDGEELNGILYSDCWDWGYKGNAVDVREGKISIKVKPKGVYILKTAEKKKPHRGGAFCGILSAILLMMVWISGCGLMPDPFAIRNPLPLSEQEMLQKNDEDTAFKMISPKTTGQKNAETDIENITETDQKMPEQMLKKTDDPLPRPKILFAGQRYFLQQLEEPLYQKFLLLYDAVLQKKPEVDLREDCSEEEIEILQYILADECPELFHFNGITEWRTYSIEGRRVSVVSLSYNALAEDYEENLRKCREKIGTILQDCDSDVFKTEMCAYSYLTENCRYDKGAENSGNAYGALIENAAKCDGISKAMKWILESAGITCLVNIGTETEGSEGHAWNLMEADGQYYSVDVTSDIETDHQKLPLYPAVNVRRDWVENVYPVSLIPCGLTLPVSSGNEKNYHLLHGGYIAAGDPYREMVLAKFDESYSGEEHTARIQFESEEDYHAFMQEIDTLVSDWAQTRELRESFHYLYYYKENYRTVLFELVRDE